MYLCICGGSLVGVSSTGVGDRYGMAADKEL